MTYLFRPQRGSLAEAMAEVREIPTMQALRDVLSPRTLVSIKKYGGVDARIGWDTWMVVDDWGVAGFTNGVPPEEA